ncbi:hypothetical protein FF38_06830 [Lucilia cuprina]|uniref:UBX domain-containing protein n=1 Tax=Lucilia cuprina TaxID=7375 RepID=A0A0L0C727_LUCCU|nr:hypothetical protein FF38_06830 [Lucilia cuprina]
MILHDAEDCILTLTKYLENIVKFPEEEKYYKIRMSNRIFCEKVRYVEGALDFLQAAGFREVDLDDEKFLIWSKDNVEQDYELPTLIEALQNSEPIQLVLDRNIKVLLPSQAKRVVLPDDFYRISPEEIKREQQLRAEAIESAQILKTKAMREREEQRALRMYKYALVRVKFPNGLFIQGTFSVYEKICDIFEFVQSCLQDESMEFNLVASSEGKFTEEDMDKTLYDLSCKEKEKMRSEKARAAAMGSYMRRMGNYGPIPNAKATAFNRADIVINDLPAGMEDLVAVGVKIGSIHDVQISENDINHVCYFNNRKAILIKFNRVSLRDKIMKQYLSSRSLTVRDVIGGDIASRVYLNDHYSPAAKLNAICRKLLNRKIISKYKILNNDRVKAKITMSGGDEIDEIRSILCNSILDAFAVTETWLKPYVSTRSVNILGFKFVRNDRLNSRGGGVGIYVSSKLKYRFVFQTSELGICESLFIEISMDSSTVLFGVVYLPYGDLISFENLHHELFLRSSDLRALCLRNNLSTIHNSRPTHFDVAHGSTSLIDFWLVIDISMLGCSDQIQYPYLSHHAFIFASFVFNKLQIDDYIEIKNFESIDMSVLLLFLSEYDFTRFTLSNVDEHCTFISSLFDCLMNFVPTTRRKVCHVRDVWMNSREVVYAKSLRDLAYHSFRLHRSEDNWTIYCRIWFIIRRIYSVNMYLPMHIRYKLAHSLMMPLILYALEVFSGTCSRQLDKVKRLVNSIVRFVYGVRRREHISGYYTCPICIANKASTNTPITPNVNINESTNPSSQTSDICDELRKCFVELSTSLEKQQNSYKMELEKQLQNGIQVFQKKVDDILNAVRAEYSNKINQLEEVKSGVDVVHMVDKSLNDKILELEKQNDVLQRRLNRTNIVIQGLPKGIKDLRYPIA